MIAESVFILSVTDETPSGREFLRESTNDTWAFRSDGGHTPYSIERFLVTKNAVGDGPGNLLAISRRAHFARLRGIRQKACFDE